MRNVPNFLAAPLLVIMGTCTSLASASAAPASPVRKHKFSEVGATADHSASLIRKHNFSGSVAADGVVRISDSVVASTPEVSSIVVRSAMKSKRLEIDADGDIQMSVDNRDENSEGVPVYNKAASPIRKQKLSGSAAADDAARITVDAAWPYYFLYPLVINQVTLDDTLPLKMVTSNMWIHMRTRPSAEFEAVIRPNGDTLYSMAHLDLTNGPIIIDLPAIKGRFYLFMIMDMWTNVFGSLGSRTVIGQPSPLSFAICGPSIDCPKTFCREGGGCSDVTASFTSETTRATMFLRLGINSLEEEEFQAIHTIQNETALYIPNKLKKRGRFMTHRRAWDCCPDGVVEKILYNSNTFKRPRLRQSEKGLLGGQLEDQSAVVMNPAEIVANMAAEEFFEFASSLILDGSPLTPWDAEAERRLAEYGINTSEQLDWASLSDDKRTTLEQAKEQAFNIDMTQVWTSNSPDWGVVCGLKLRACATLEQDYLDRFILAKEGLWANQGLDAVYLTSNPVIGHHLLTIPGAPEPVRFSQEGFWSVTIYDAYGYIAGEPYNIGSLTIGDALPQTITLGGPDENAPNFMPIPDATYTVIIRLYVPSDDVLDNNWPMPVLTLVSPGN